MADNQQDQTAPFTEEELARVAAWYMRASDEKKRWLWRLVFAMRQGLSADDARRIAGPMPD